MERSKGEGMALRARDRLTVYWYMSAAIGASFAAICSELIAERRKGMLTPIYDTMCAERLTVEEPAGLPCPQQPEPQEPPQKPQEDPPQAPPCLPPVPPEG